MTTSAPLPDRQPSLFEALPETEPRRRRGRRPAKPPADSTDPVVAPTIAAVAPVPVAAPFPVVAAPSAMTCRGLAEEPRRSDPTALTNPELSDLVAALTESSLGFLLVEVVHEVKRRLVSPEPSEDEEAAPAIHQPNPQLLRALRTAMMELNDSD